MTKRISLLFVYCLTCIGMYAAQIDLQQALMRAAGNNTKCRAAATWSDLTPSYIATDADGNYLYYIVNYPDGNGWVIVAADDNFPALIAYGTEGKLNMDSLPPNMRLTMDMYERNISEVIHADIQLNAAKVPAQRQTAIPNFVTALWDQSYPFNIVVREQTGSSCYTGCVATAMAMAMHHNRYPAQGIGEHTYTWKTGVDLSRDFTQSTYNWDLMPDNIYGQSESEQRAVAQLMYDCGVSVDMGYSTSASGANAFKVPGALYQYFGYDDGMRLLMQRTHSMESWKQLIYDELAAGRVVLYQGSDANVGGHFFLCSGCDGNDMYYINWGWSGSSNGYYNLETMNPRTYSFVNDALCITGVKPSDDVEDDGFNVIGMGSLKLYYKNDGQTVDRRNNSTEYLWPESNGFMYGFYNMHWDARPIKFGVIFENEEDPTDISTQEAYLYHDYTNNAPTLAVGGRITNFQIHHNQFPQNGVYRMYPAATDARGNWHKIPFDANSPQFIKVTCTPTQFTYNYPTAGLGVLEAQVQPHDGWYNVRSNVDIVADVSNVGDGDYYGSLTLKYKHPQDGYWIQTEQQAMVTAGGSATVTFRINPSKAGLYSAYIQDAADKTICDNISFVVKDPSKPVSLQVSGNSNISVAYSEPQQNSMLRIMQKTDEQQLEVSAQVPVTCTKGFYYGALHADIGDDADWSTVGHTTSDTFALHSGESKVVTLKGTMPAKSGKYFLSITYTGDDGTEKMIDVPDDYYYGTDFSVSIMTDIQVHHADQNITAIYTLEGVCVYNGSGKYPTLGRGTYVFRSADGTSRLVIIR